MATKKRFSPIPLVPISECCRSGALFDRRAGKWYCGYCGRWCKVSKGVRLEDIISFLDEVDGRIPPASRFAVRLVRARFRSLLRKRVRPQHKRKQP